MTDSIDTNTLVAITGDQNLVVRSENFNTLTSIVGNLLNVACRTTPRPPPVTPRPTPQPPPTVGQYFVRFSIYNFEQHKYIKTVSGQS